jgi:hypothetical protein
MKLIISNAVEKFFISPCYKDLQKFIQEKDGEFYITCEYPNDMPTIQKIGIKLKLC